MARWVYAKSETMTVYATDDPYVAEVVDRTGHSEKVPVMQLLKFGWELDEPLGWPDVDIEGNPKPLEPEARL